MKKLKITSWYNNIHFLVIPLLLTALSFKYYIFILFLIIYLIYITRKKIFTKAIYIITIISSITYLTYKLYTPSIADYKGVIVEIDENKYVCRNPIYSVIFYSDDEYKIGDIIRIDGDKSIPKSESYEYGFSYRDYLKSKRIYYIYKNPTIKKYTNVPIPVALREVILNKLAKKLDTKSLSYVSALIFAKNDIDDTTKEDIKTLGLSHMFAISGFHISIMFMFLTFALKKIDNEKIRNNIIISFFVFYVFLTGFQISILRSVIMIILSILNKRYNRLYTSLDILSISIFIVFILNPGYLYQLSFILTYLITFFLLITRKLIKGRYKSYKMALLAFLSSLPIIININNNINLLQLILVPLFSFVIGYIMLPYLFILIFIPILKKINIIGIFEGIISKIGDIKIFTFTFESLNIYFIIIYYILFIFLLIMLERKRKNKIIISSFFIYIIFLSCIRLSNFYYQIEFIDVGQGDTILITSPHNRDVVLIDTFGYNRSYLKRRGINKIDYLIITHSDNDHMGAIEETLKSFDVETIVSSEYDDIGYDTRKVKSGDNILLEDITLKVLGPINKASEINNNSIVIQINIYNHKILLAGDMEYSEEMDLIGKYNNTLKSEVLKLGHHGSSSSTSQDFVDVVKPKYSIVSCGLNNKYGFPSSDVLSRVKKSKVYRTDLMGNISVKITKSKIDIKGYK